MRSLQSCERRNITAGLRIKVYLGNGFGRDETLRPFSIVRGRLRVVFGALMLGLGAVLFRFDIDGFVRFQSPDMFVPLDDFVLDGE